MGRRKKNQNKSSKSSSNGLGNPHHQQPQHLKDGVEKSDEQKQPQQHQQQKDTGPMSKPAIPSSVESPSTGMSRPSIPHVDTSIGLRDDDGMSNSEPGSPIPSPNNGSSGDFARQTSSSPARKPPTLYRTQASEDKQQDWSSTNPVENSGNNMISSNSSTTTTNSGSESGGTAWRPRSSSTSMGGELELGGLNGLPPAHPGPASASTSPVVANGEINHHREASEPILSQQHDKRSMEEAPIGRLRSSSNQTTESGGIASPIASLPEDDFIRYYVKGADETLDDNSEPVQQPPGLGFFDFIWHDLGIEPEEDQGISSKNATVEDDVFNFIRVPLEIEKLLFFGFFLCADSLLFILVYLPLRVVRATFLLVCTIVYPKNKRFRFHRAQLYDLLRASILCVAFVVLLEVHMSRIYHYVRGQTFIKLYVIFNMLDIFDRLMCSIGQDIMDSLFYMTKTSPTAVIRISFRFILGVFYVTIHSLLYFVRLITLNAAINSTSNALLTLLISNNFVELKGSVFKRFAEQNLFQITCSDMVERFELFVFLSLTAMQSSETWTEFFYGSVFYIVACEMLVDWIKHAFITKFNRIHFASYGNFSEALCRDIAPVGNHKHPYAAVQRLNDRPVDSTQTVSQHIGLATLPLTCVILRFLWVNAPQALHDNPWTVSNVVFVVLVYACLLCTKSLINIMLKGHACRVLMYRERRILSKNSPRLSSLPVTPTEKELQKAAVAKHMQKIDQFSGIRRYQIFKSRIPT